MVLESITIRVMVQHTKGNFAMTYRMGLAWKLLQKVHAFKENSAKDRNMAMEFIFGPTVQDMLAVGLGTRSLARARMWAAMVVASWAIGKIQ
jgi:hypothetical protein